MVRILLTYCLILLTSFIDVNGQSITIGIKLNGTTVVPGGAKTAKVCPSSTFNLQANNISLAPPSGVPIYEWRNLDNATTQNAQSINTTIIGRWVAKISYFNSGTGTWNSAEDTITITLHTPATFNMLNGSGNPITATNFYACSSRDTTVSATNGFTDYKWYKANLSNLIASTQNLTVNTTVLSSTEGVVTFIVTAKDVNGCNVSAQKSFRRDVSVGFTLGNDTTICSGNSVQIKPTTTTGNALPPAGSSPLFKYSWSTGATNVDAITVSTAGTYRLIIQNLGTGCAFRDDKAILFSPAPAINITPDTAICFGTNLQVTSSAVGNGPFTYSWSPSTGVSNVNISNPVITPSTVGTNTYTVTIKDGIQCTVNKSINIYQHPPGTSPYFTLSAGKDTSICHGATVHLEALIVDTYLASYTYVWSGAPGLSTTTGSSTNYTPTSTGVNTITLTATDNRGCVNSTTVDVNQLSRITVTPNFIDTIACASLNVQMIVFANGGLTGGVGYEYTWAPLGTTTPNNNSYIVPVGIDETIYTVIAKDSIGCMGDTTIRTQGYGPALKVSGSPDTIGFNNNPMVLTAYTDPSFTVEWFDTFGGSLLGTGINHTLVADGKIYAKVYDPIKDCYNSDTVQVTFFTANPFLVFVPNVFSPQASQEENRVLKVFGFMIQDDGFKFIVYNQWGQIVYQTSSFTEANKGWSGEINSNSYDQSIAVYTYVVKGKYYDGTEFDLKGTSTMLH
ncbi:MAG: gliding motility-associated C-terminal domain-containing protein [Cytophagaceae bacterium]